MIFRGGGLSDGKQILRGEKKLTELILDPCPILLLLEQANRP